MKFSVLYSLFFLCVTVEKTVLGSGSSPCGGILEWNSGKFEFFPGPPPSEFQDETLNPITCIWIIQSQKGRDITLTLKELSSASTVGVFPLNTFKSIPPNGETWGTTTKWTSLTPEENKVTKLGDGVGIIVLTSTSPNPCFSFSWTSDVVSTPEAPSETGVQYLTVPQGVFEIDGNGEWMQRMVWLFDVDRKAVVDMNVTHWYGCLPESECDGYNTGIMKVTPEGNFAILKSYCGCEKTTHDMDDISAPILLITNTAATRNPSKGQIITWDSTFPEIVEETTTTTTTTTTEEPEIPDPPPTPPATCGGVVQVGAYSATLVEYKLNENYENYERCTWVLEATNCKTICLTFDAMDFADDIDGISLYGWDKDSLAYHAQIYKADFGNKKAYCYDFPTLLLHFKSHGGTVGKGFKISGYCDSYDSSGYYSYLNKWWQSSGTWEYPGNGQTNYPINQVAAAFFDPVSSNREEKLNKLYIDYYNIEYEYECFYDVLVCWELYGREGGKGRGVFCGSNQEPKLITSYYSLLCVFSSDYVTTDKGFEISCLAED